MWTQLNFRYILLATFAAIAGVFLNKYFGLNNNIASRSESSREKYLTVNDLVRFNGIIEERLYLAVLGTVYDVTEGKKHYGKGSSYNYFIGKDGSRALITGNFKDESNNKDHVLDLTCDEIMNILKWRRTFKDKYIHKGFLIGRYYDEYGAETAYMNELKQKIKDCRIKKEEEKKQEQQYPPCNMAWSEDTGSRVWCSKSSGGIVRNWEGVPRQLYTPGEEKPRCVCVNLNNTGSSMLKEYPGCPGTSTECVLEK